MGFLLPVSLDCVLESKGEAARLPEIRGLLAEAAPGTLEAETTGGTRGRDFQFCWEV